MFAGGDETGIPRQLLIDEPYDSLSFVPTILNLMGLHHEAETCPADSSANCCLSPSRMLPNRDR